MSSHYQKISTICLTVGRFLINAFAPKPTFIEEVDRRLMLSFKSIRINFIGEELAAVITSFRFDKSFHQTQHHSTNSVFQFETLLKKAPWWYKQLYKSNKQKRIIHSFLESVRSHSIWFVCNVFEIHLRISIIREITGVFSSRRWPQNFIGNRYEVLFLSCDSLNPAFWTIFKVLKEGLQYSFQLNSNLFSSNRCQKTRV